MEKEAKAKLISLGIIILIVSILIGIVIYKSLTNTEKNPHINDIKMYEDLSDPYVYESTVVFEKWDSIKKANHILVRDLSTNEEVLIANDTHAAFPTIYRNYVVWGDFRNEDSDIYCYDLQEKKEFVICKEDEYQGKPFIYKDLIIWQDYRDLRGMDHPHYFSDIYAYNLSTGEEYLLLRQEYQISICSFENNIITFISSDYDFPPEVISGDQWIYSGLLANENTSLYQYNLDTNELNKLSYGNDVRTANSRNGNIAWVEKSSDSFQLYFKNSQSITSKSIYTNHWPINSLSITDEYVFLCQNYNPFESDIWRYDIEDKQVEEFYHEKYYDLYTIAYCKDRIFAEYSLREENMVIKEDGVLEIKF